jgi:hypothetical protein
MLLLFCDTFTHGSREEHLDLVRFRVPVVVKKWLVVPAGVSGPSSVTGYYIAEVCVLMCVLG